MKLLLSVRLDLEDVVPITSSWNKQTNHLRALIAMLTQGNDSQLLTLSW